MKYFGSKSRIAKQIVLIIQKYIDDGNYKTYVEPFVGGFNVIDKIRCENRYGNDLNKYLIALFSHLIAGGGLYESVSKELYDKARRCWRNGTSEFSDWQLGCIGFLASFGGRWFDGGYAKPSWNHNRTKLRNHYDEAKRNILKQIQQPLFKDIILSNFDYKELSFENSVIYADPPYQNTKEFDNAKNFNYKEFWEIMRLWSQNNVVLISELQAPDDFECIWEREVTRTTNNKNIKKAVEKLFVYSK